MTITLELSAEQERRLREGTHRKDADAVREVLLGAIDSTVEDLLSSPSRKLAEPDFEMLADRLAESFARTSPSNHRPLSDEAVTREGIYGDHP